MSREAQPDANSDDAPNFPVEAQIRTRRVTFATLIQVHVWQENHDFVLEVPCASLHDWLRGFWHLNGQICAWNTMIEVMSSRRVPWLVWSPNDSQVYIEGMADHHLEIDQNAVTACPQNTSDGASRLESDWTALKTLISRSTTQSRKFVETWFVHPVRQPCCTHSRRILVDGTESSRDFEDKLRRTWDDWIQVVPVSWHLVRPTPRTLATTCAHVVVTEMDENVWNAVLLKCDAFPLLAKHRAIVFSDGSTVLDIFRQAQVHTCFREVNTICAIQPVQNEQLIYTNFEVPNFFQAELISGSIRFQDSDDEENASDADQSDEDGESTQGAFDSTTVFNSSEDDDLIEDSDHSSLVTAPPIITCEFSHNAYPWNQMPEPNHAEQFDQVDGEIPDMVFAEGHDDAIMTALAEAQQLTEGDPTCTVITFGLGLTPLGKREFDLDELNIYALQERIHDMWFDHAQHGQLEVLYVQPQPPIAVSPFLVLIVVVNYGEEDPTDVRNLIIEHAQDIRHEQNPYAARLQGHVTATGVTHQLGLHQCFPNGIRDCHVEQGGVAMNRHERQHIQDGALITITIDAYPDSVGRIGRYMTNAETFVRHVRSEIEARGEEDGTFTLRVHGISPRNRPLGHRDLHITLAEIGTFPGIQRVVNMWPFCDQLLPQTVFVPTLTQGQDDTLDQLVLHVIVAYVSHAEGIPLAIRQTVSTPDGTHSHSEIWAAYLYSESYRKTILRRLHAPPFWVDESLETQILLEGTPVEQIGRFLRFGEVLDLRCQVDTATDLLQFLLAFGGSEMPEAESIVLLQQNFHKRTKKALDQEARPDLTDRKLKEQDVQLIRSLQQIVQELCQEEWVGLNTSFQYVPLEHPFAQIACQVTGQTSEIPNVFHVYTDGSCKAGIAAWSFVVIAEIRSTQGTSFAKIGYAGDLVDPQDRRATSIDAEADAITAAVEYLLSRKVPDDVQIHFHYDATVVGHAALGTQSIPQTAHAKVYRARVLMSILQRKNTQTKGFHIHGHSGQPWNEFADNIAGKIRMGWTCEITPQLKSPKLMSHPLCAWAWLEVQHDTEFPGIEQMLRNHEPQQEKPIPDPTLHLAQREPDEQHVIDIWMATANVGTMNYNKENSHESVSHKSQELQHQFDCGGYDIVALQETRALHSQTKMEGPHLRFISASQGGQGGVEIWVHLEQIQKKLGVNIDYTTDLMVWHQDHRCLAMHFNLANLEFDCVSIYAPQKARPDEEIQGWWQNLSLILDNRGRTCPIFLLGDCNCAIGSVTTDGIGEHASDMEDQAGAFLRELCDQHELVIPSTMERWHRGQTHTYVGTRGERSRLDYILISNSCSEGIVQSMTDSDIDLLNGERDHIVLALHLQVTFMKQQRSGFTRQRVYDRHAAQQSLKERQPPDDLSLARVKCDWDIGVNTHWSELREHLTTAAAKCFPKQKRQKRQLYFTEESWRIVCSRKDLRQQHFDVQRAIAFQLLTCVFKGWKEGRNDHLDAHNRNIHLLMMQDAIVYEQRDKLHQVFKHSKALDWKNWFTAQWNEQIQKANSIRGSDVFKIFRPKRMIQKHAGKTRRALPGLCMANGQWMTSRDEVARGWQAQFSTIENACEATIEHVQADSTPNTQIRDIEFLKQIPTMYDLETAIRGLQHAKAPGADNVGAELLKLHFPANIPKLYMLLAKTCLRGQAVAELCGGWLIPLHKGKMHVAKMEGYRAILLEPTLARSYSRSWRSRVAEAANCVAVPMQHGGRRGLSIEPLHLQVRLWLANAKQLGKSVSILYVDLKSAFYTVIKPLLAGYKGDHEGLKVIARRMMLPDHVFPKLLQHVEEANLIRHASQSEAMEEMVQATLASTWFCIPGGDTVFRPSTGSRPGDPLADLLFSFVVTRMLSIINSKLETQEIFDCHPQEDILLAQNITYVDDMAFVIQAEATKLISKTALVIAEILEVFTEHGFTLSYGAGKTALTIDFHGKHATKSRQQCEAAHPHHLEVMNEHIGCVKVPILPHYRHLGGYVTRTASILPEIKNKSKQLAARMKPLNKITKDPKIDLQHRRQILKSFAMPILTMHAGTWFNMNQGEFAEWKAAVHRLYMALQPRTAQGQVQHLTIHELSWTMQSPAPMELLHIQRLRLLIHIAKDGDGFLFSAIVYNHRIAQEQSWLHTIKSSIQWLVDQIGEFSLPEELNHLDQVETWEKLHVHQKLLKRLVQKALHAHLWRLRLYCELKKTNNIHEAILQQMGWTPPPRTEKPSDEVEAVACDRCDRTFSNEAALATHQQRKHGDRIAARRWVQDPICRICGKNFRTRTRLLQHLHHGQTTCWYMTFRSFAPITHDEANTLDQLDREQGLAFHQKGLKDRQHDLACCAATEEEIAKIVPCNRDPDQEPPRLDELENWKSFGLLPPGRGGRQKTTRQHKDFQVPNTLEDTQALERDIQQTAKAWMPDDSWVPRPHALGTKYILVLFSGHRRWGDIAMHIQAIGTAVPIPVDIALDPIHGNLMESDLWERLILARKVIGAHAAPPCETFSEARWIPHEDSIFPRPLRTFLYPWIMLARTLSEVRQGTIGSLLFLRTTVLLLLVYATGGAFSLEHPKGPDPDSGRFSIWMSGLLMRMSLAAEVQRVDFLQGPLGRKFAKPTVLYAARLPHLASAIYEQYDRHWKPQIVLGGKCHTTGSWKTSQAKEYPERLSFVIASQLCMHAENIATEEDEIEPPELEQALAALHGWDPYNVGHGDAMQSDYHPNVRGAKISDQ